MMITDIIAIGFMVGDQVNYQCLYVCVRACVCVCAHARACTCALAITEFWACLVYQGDAQIGRKHAEKSKGLIKCSVIK